MLLKVLAALVIVGITQCQGQTFFLQGTQEQINRFQSLKSMITSCQKKFVCQITTTATSDMVECVDQRRRCDGHNDCSNSRDEQNCPALCTGKVICPDRRTCADPCDGNAQCPGHEDELGCAKRCTAGRVLCGDKQTCAVPCDHIEQCPDGRDELRCPIKCPFDQMQCNDNKKCGIKCNGVRDCSGGEDETTCPFSCRCPKGSYLCNAEDRCLPRARVCNEIQNECMGDDDETPCA